MKKTAFLENISVCHLCESIWPKVGYFKINKLINDIIQFMDTVM